MVASCDVQFPIGLEQLQNMHARFCSVCMVLILETIVQYEPEIFPGLIYKMEDPRVVLLIFVSGKIVITGAKVCSVL